MSPTLDPLAEFANLTRRGDPIAARRLLDGLAPHILRIVRMMLGAHHPDVDDICQEALLSIVNTIHTYRGEGSVLRFAHTVAVRRVLDLRRSRAHLPNKVSLDTDDAEPVIDPARSPEENTLSGRRLGLFRGLLLELSEVQAEALALHFLLEYSVEEIAHRTSTPVETVRSRLRLAKQTIHQRIMQEPKWAELAEKQCG